MTTLVVTLPGTLKIYMDYTMKKDHVIFELPLSDYFGKSKRYNYKTKSREDYWINSVQDYEESIFDNFDSYMSMDEINQYYSPKQADQYLLKKGYKKEEIDLFRDQLNSDILRACADAKNSSYQYEWLKKFFKYTQEQINNDLSDNLGSIDYKLLDRLDDDDFKRNRTDQKFLRLEINKKAIKDWLKDNYQGENWHNESEYIDYFHDYALDFTRKPINTEYIDRYGTLGDCDDWLTYFQDFEETSAKIDEYRKNEADKIDNAERASLELKNNLMEIDRYTAKYFTKKETREKIARQVSALKSVIKNAV